MRAMQAQTALVAKEQEKAKTLLMESLQALNPDDWAGYMLLFSCCLPSTALPFEQAAEGLISVQGGFGGLDANLRNPEHWTAMQAGADAGEGSYHGACNDLAEFLHSIVSKVASSYLRPAPIPLHYECRTTRVFHQESRTA